MTVVFKGEPMKKLVLILTIALVGVAAWSQSSSSGFLKQQLAGVTGFVVSVSVKPDSLALLLPISSIRTDVELKLRIAHIPVLPGDQPSMNFNAGMISVEVDGVRSSSSPTWAIYLRVECSQWAHLIRDPHVVTEGLTWSDGTVAMFGEAKVPDLRDEIKDLIDEFVNLYLASNP